MSLSRASNGLLAQLLFVLTAPALLNVSLSISSAAPGLVATSALMLATTVALHRRAPIRAITLLLPLLVMLGGALYGMHAFGFGNFTKPMGSMLLLMLCLVNLLVILERLLRHVDDVPNFSTAPVFGVFVVIALGGLSGMLTFGGYGSMPYPVPPFSEPSHYAMAMLACGLLFIVTRPTKGVWWLVASVTTALALLFPNTTLLVSGLMIWAIRLHPATMFTVLLVGGTGVLLNLDATFLQYFVDRVSFSDESQNTSALVYMQGLEAITHVWNNALFFGLGFQSLGLEEPGPIADLIFDINGEYKNRADGGFVVAKLIGEYGVIGLLIAIAMTAQAVRGFMVLNRHARRRRGAGTPLTSRSMLVLAGLSYMTLLELYVRSFGYFSATFLLGLLAQLTLFWRSSRPPLVQPSRTPDSGPKAGAASVRPPEDRYDFVFVTQLPSFYKVNLYNELAQRARILVVFVGAASAIRSPDFTRAERRFEHRFLSEGAFEKRSRLRCLWRLSVLLARTPCKFVLVNGWDLPEFWLALWFGRAQHRALVLESTGIGAATRGAKAGLKRLFLRRAGWVMASGQLHHDFARRLGFHGQIVVTRGVGILNKPTQTPCLHSRAYRKRFLYLGRIAPEKNLPLLLQVFNELADEGYQLTLAGGDANRQEGAIRHLGHVDNQGLAELFSTHDMLILPSLEEPWGLVVEEALYFGLPVLVSKVCGAAELVEPGGNGLRIDPTDPQALLRQLRAIDDSLYQRMRAQCGPASIDIKDAEQVASYVQALTTANTKRTPSGGDGDRP